MKAWAALLVVAAALCGDVRADDEDGKLALNFASSRGITGMRDLLDARVR